jgi:hypothetical protein
VAEVAEVEAVAEVEVAEVEVVAVVAEVAVAVVVAEEEAGRCPSAGIPGRERPAR